MYGSFCFNEPNSIYSCSIGNYKLVSSWTKKKNRNYRDPQEIVTRVRDYAFYYKPHHMVDDYTAKQNSNFQVPSLKVKSATLLERISAEIGEIALESSFPIPAIHLSFQKLTILPSPTTHNWLPVQSRAHIRKFTKTDEI